MNDDSSTQETHKEEEEETERNACYICWDDTGTSDNPIRRDCGCNGTAGWVHAECLIQSAEITGRMNPLDSLLQPWSKCRQCLQPYTEPTKSVLNRSLIQDRPRLIGRLASSFVSVGRTTIICFTLIVFLSMSWCFVDLFLRIGEDFMVPVVAALWDESCPEVRVVVVAAVVAILYKIFPPVDQWPIRRMLLQCALVAYILLSAIVVTEGGVYGEVIVVAVTFLAMAVWVYRARDHIRQQAAEIQHQGILPTVVHVIAVAAFVYLQHRVETFITPIYLNMVTEMQIPDDETFSQLMHQVRTMGFVGDTAGVGTRELISENALPGSGDYWHCCI